MGPEPSPGLAWSLEFAQPDGTGGLVRRYRAADRSWFWAYLVVPGIGVVTVRDHELPAGRDDRVVRGDGLWSELVEDVPGQHVNVALEAFGVRLDDPLDALRGERGERVPVGLDVEWEAAAGWFGHVHGELLVGSTRRPFDHTGTFEHRPAGGGDGRGSVWTVTWQVEPADGHRVQVDAASVRADERGLPRGVAVDGTELAVAAVAVVPSPSPTILGLLRGGQACGWLEGAGTRLGGA